jgi:hypothetical protein
VEAHEEPESINWPEFRAAFCAHHVPQGVIKLEKKEFQDLKQGSMSVNEYITKFTQSVASVIYHRSLAVVSHRVATFPANLKSIRRYR